MREVEILGQKVVIEDLQISCKDKRIKKLLDKIVESTNDRFSNSEVYPDGDLALIKYLQKRFAKSIMDRKASVVNGR